VAVRERINHFEKLDAFIQKNDLKKRDFCFVGSSILAEKDLRNNGDIDIAIIPSKRSKIDIESLSQDLSIAKERYSWMEITDKDLIENEKLHYEVEGYKFARPELVYSYKKRRKWEKDEIDKELIEESLIQNNSFNWDWDLFNYEYYPKPRNERGLPKPRFNNPSMLFRFARSVENKGFFGLSKYLLRNRILKNKYREAGLEDLIYFVIWPTAFHQKNNIISRIETRFESIEVEEIDLGDDMELFIEEMYSYNNAERFLGFKKEKIASEGSKIVFLKAKIGDSLNEGIDRFLSNFKDDVRKEFFAYMPDDSYHNILHGPDDLDENEWIHKVIEKYR